MLDNDLKNLQGKPQFQAMTPSQLQQQQVAMQAVNPELLKQGVQDSYVANRVKASEDTNPLAMLGVGAGVWYAISQYMDRFNYKCKGEYDKSVFGKLGKWGDNFSQNNVIGRKLEQFFQWVKGSTDNLAKKSKTVYSLKNHSTRPEWSFAKMPGAGLHGFLAGDTEQVFEEFLMPISKHPSEKLFIIPMGGKYNAFQKLEQYGLKQADIDAFRNSVKSLNFDQQALALQKKELELLGASKDMISKIEGKKGLEGLQKLAKSLKVKKLGLKSIREYEGLHGKFLDNPKRIMEVLETADKNGLKFSIWRGNGKIRNHFWGRIVTPSEYLNKYKATLGLGNKTTIGRFLPKALGWFMEGCTNRVAGGKLAVAMQAGIFADMLIHTFKAPKGEKGKTLAERFVNDFTYFLAMTAGIIGMHKIGGFKYIGIDKKGVEAYRRALETFNKQVKAGVFSGNKKAYKDAAKAVDNMLVAKGTKLNIFQKLLQKTGKLINIGNERKLSYVSNKKLNMNLLRKCLNGNILGVPLRILIPMGMVSPFLAKWATKTAHAIFGKPTKSVLDEDKEDNTQKQAEQMQQNPFMQPTQLPPQLQPNSQQLTQNGAIKRTYIPSPVGVHLDTEKTNLLNQYKNSHNIVNNNTTNVQNNGTDLKNPKEPLRNYIPSPMAAQVRNTEDTSAADAALRRADAAEQQALKILGM